MRPSSRNSPLSRGRRWSPRRRDLAFYRYLAEHYRAPLAAGGALVLEIGATQRAAVERFLGQNGWEEIGAAQDLGGKDRCVFARRPAEKG